MSTLWDILIVSHLPQGPRDLRGGKKGLSKWGQVVHSLNDHLWLLDSAERAASMAPHPGHHLSPPWAQSSMSKFQQGAEQFYLLGREEKIRPVARTILSDGLRCPKPSVSSGKRYSCSTYCCCLWAGVSPHSEAGHLPHRWTLERYWTVRVMQSLDVKKFQWHNKQRAGYLQCWDQHLHSTVLTTNKPYHKTWYCHL